MFFGDVSVSACLELLEEAGRRPVTVSVSCDAHPSGVTEVSLSEHLLRLCAPACREPLKLSMEDALVQTLPTMDVVLDVENPLPSDKCSRSPKLIRALSRKVSCRPDRPPSEEHEADEPFSRATAKCVQGGAASQLDAFKQPLVPNKPLLPLTSSATGTSLVPGDNDGRCKKFNRFTAMHPRKILLIFATLSSMGTIILIYFTLSIHKSARVQHGK